MFAPLGGNSRQRSKKEVPMKSIYLSVVGTTIAVLAAVAPAAVQSEPKEKKGTTSYVTHFIFRPLMTIDTAELGKATTLEAVGTTQNMKGERCWTRCPHVAWR
jgi:hypothetical protein